MDQNGLWDTAIFCENMSPDPPSSPSQYLNANAANTFNKWVELKVTKIFYKNHLFNKNNR